jgi:hypothetical protein
MVYDPLKKLVVDFASGVACERAVDKESYVTILESSSTLETEESGECFAPRLGFDFLGGVIMDHFVPLDC